jgi:NitT/TauT family transport system ATP-binding protein
MIVKRRVAGNRGVALSGRKSDNGAEGAAVTVTDVSYAYPNGTEALNGVSFVIPRAKSVGIVGPSGCGKSTLLGVISGLLSASAGSVSVAPGPTDRHQLSMMFQKDTLLPWLTVSENIRLFYRFHRADHEAISQRVAELTRLVGLQGFENFYPYQLSGGMRRRVGLLAAVAPRPETLLLDEPFSSLDEPTRVLIHQELFDIVRRFAISVVLVTHDLAEAITLCDEIIILSPRPGQIAARFEIPFGTERNVLELRRTREFLEIYGQLWNELSQQIKRGRSGAGDDAG